MALAALFGRQKSAEKPELDGRDAPALGDSLLPSAGETTGSPGGQVEELIGEGRYCLVLNGSQESAPDAVALAAAWKALEEDMALVPAGEICLTDSPAAGFEANRAPGVPVCGAPVQIQAVYLDCFAVTHSDFASFTAAGGYERMELWPEELWPRLVQFVDQTGFSGPRFWTNGQPPRNRENHPVTGICWYEAQAFARWIGKRLPTSPEWERAGSWPSGVDGREAQVRYPWGNSFNPSHTNMWISGPGETVPVDEHQNGCTPNGIFQLIGNVWEWVDGQYLPFVPEGFRVVVEQPLAEIRGGAFDTYFENQATCQFRTGQPFLFRESNVGFRCAVSADQLARPPAPAAFF